VPRRPHPQVLYVEDLTAQNRVERELVLIKVRAPNGPARTEVTELAKIFRAHILDTSGA
jgi:acetolactate synthase I/III small subunit